MVTSACDWRTEHQIGLPIAVTLTTVCDLRPKLDRDLMGDRAAPFAHAAPLAAMLVVAQRQMQIAARALVFVDAAVDRLVREARHLLDALMPSDLLRTPGLGQLEARKLPRRIRHTPRVGGASSAALGGQRFSNLRPIIVARAIATELARDGGGGASELGGNRPYRPAR